MGKKKIIIIMSSIISITIVSGFVVTTVFHTNNNSNKGTASASTFIPVTKGNVESDFTYIPPVPKDESDEDNDTSFEESVPFVPATEMDLNPESITVLVNKEYCLPKDYRPKNMVIPDVLFDLTYYDERKLMRPEAAEALENMFNEAKTEGIYLYGISAYRSYQRQKSIFLNNIVKRGKVHTLRYSAVPGTSEHQTGLSIDVSTKGLKYKLVTSFATSQEGKWLAENAHRFGYIIRYPKDKEDITGYAYEPWHIRFVGKDLAQYLFDNQLTLDEYYNYKPSVDFNFEETYADFINYKPPVTKAPIQEDEQQEDEELVDGDFEEGLEAPEDIDAPDKADKDSDKTGKDSDNKKDKTKDKSKNEDSKNKDQETVNKGNNNPDQDEIDDDDDDEDGTNSNPNKDQGDFDDVESDEEEEDNNEADDNEAEETYDPYTIPENGIIYPTN